MRRGEVAERADRLRGHQQRGDEAHEVADGRDAARDAPVGEGDDARHSEAAERFQHRVEAGAVAHRAHAQVVNLLEALVEPLGRVSSSRNDLMSRAPDSFSVNSEVMSPSSFWVRLATRRRRSADRRMGSAAIG